MRFSFLAQSRWVIADGDGNEPKPFKAEWATIKAHIFSVQAGIFSKPDTFHPWNLFFLSIQTAFILEMIGVILT